MGDVADILGMGKDNPVHNTGSPSDGGKGIKQVSIKARKPAGMSREVYALLGQHGLPPLVPSRSGSVAFKEKRKSGARAWVKKQFTNSARNDDLVLKHWVKASVDLPVYPFARFNTSVDVLEYSDEEYDSIIAIEDEKQKWTKTETDHLLLLCKKYGLRWIVIADRYSLDPPREVEELKQRYFFISKLLGKTSDGNDGTKSYEYEYDKKRKNQLDMIFKRSKKDEEEIDKLNAELRNIELELKKAAAKGDSKKKKELSEITLNTTRDIKPGVYLRSAMQTLPQQNHALCSRLLQKMAMVLEEISVPARPIPTLTVCEMYDKLRQDIIRMLSLKKIISRKEEELRALTQSYSGDVALVGKGITDSTGVLGMDTSGSFTSSVKSPTSHVNSGKVVRGPQKRKGSGSNSSGKRIKKL